MINNIKSLSDYNSVCVRGICKIFASIGRFSGMGRQMLPNEFSPSDPHCHGNVFGT